MPLFSILSLAKAEFKVRRIVLGACSEWCLCLHLDFKRAHDHLLPVYSIPYLAVSLEESMKSLLSLLLLLLLLSSKEALAEVLFRWFSKETSCISACLRLRSTNLLISRNLTLMEWDEERARSLHSARGK